MQKGAPDKTSTLFEQNQSAILELYEDRFQFDFAINCCIPDDYWV